MGGGGLRGGVGSLMSGIGLGGERWRLKPRRLGMLGVRARSRTRGCSKSSTNPDSTAANSYSSEPSKRDSAPDASPTRPPASPPRSRGSSPPTASLWRRSTKRGGRRLGRRRRGGCRGFLGCSIPRYLRLLFLEFAFGERRRRRRRTSDERTRDERKANESWSWRGG